MRKLVTLLVLLFNTFIIKAQSISGSLIDESGNPISFANVVLLNRCDSSFVQGTISDENGNFSIGPFTDENILRVSCLGFLPITKAHTNSPVTIVMQKDINLLNEVVVKGNLPVTRMKGDAMVTNVENSVLSKAGSANDVLTKIPGITKKQDAFEVFGKGTPLIYINGRKLHDLSELERLNSNEGHSVNVQKI